ncbi:MAG: aminotransferase class V-fold PLP-dependent enzyme, partial [Rhodopirellula bahusiensis]
MPSPPAADSAVPESKHRIYLDHAATSWPKADGVTDAMVEFMTNVGASASRGNHASAMKASERVRSLRSKLARFVNAESADCVSFHSGCTSALNAVVHGLVGPSHDIGPGSHILTSLVEHNAVLRPMLVAARAADARVEEVPSDANGSLQVSEVIGKIDDATRLVALSHVSNVTGAVQPIAEIGEAIAEINQSRNASNRILFLCDA